MASVDLNRTCDATADSGYSKKWTWSGWVKRSELGVEQGLFANKKPSNNSASRFRFRFKSSDKLCWEIKDSTSNDDSSFESNMLFRDTNAWYHIVLIYDTDNSTATERIKCYVNGKDLRTELGGFSSDDQASSGFGSLWSSDIKTFIGVSHDNSGNPYRFDGLMSHVHFTYGYRYEASTFGSTDSTTGEWKINTSPSVTYGSQGYWMFKDNASVSDQSGEGNNFTLSAGTLTKTEDNPSNVFATLNPLVNNAGEMMRLTNGNTSCQSNAAEGNSWKLAVSTLGMTSGKYYWEIKFDNVHNCYNNGVMGSNVFVANTSNPMNQTGYTGFYNVDGGEIKKDGSDTTADYGTYATNDIMGVACDMDNYTITFYKNGSALVSNVALSTTGRDVVFPCSVFYNTNNTGIPQASYNFGNGYFGTTAVSSNSGNGYSATGSLGIFQYQPPTGYTALCTKGLNE